MTFLERLYADERIRTYIEQSDAALSAIGYTEHSFSHVMRVSETAKYILETMDYSAHDVELVQIAAYLHDIGRAEYVPITDEEAVCAFEYLSRTEGIIPAIESAHAIAQAIKMAPEMSRDQILLVTVSGRGDKDVAAIARYRGENISE